MIDYQTFHQIRHLHEQEHLTAAQIARQLDLHPQTVAKWMARPEGYQGGLFDGAGDGVNRMPAVDRATEEGKTAGLSGVSCTPPYDASTPQGQAWIKAWHEGQAVVAAGFKT